MSHAPQSHHLLPDISLSTHSIDQPLHTLRERVNEIQYSSHRRNQIILGSCTEMRQQQQRQMMMRYEIFLHTLHLPVELFFCSLPPPWWLFNANDAGPVSFLLIFISIHLFSSLGQLVGFNQARIEDERWMCVRGLMNGAPNAFDFVSSWRCENWWWCDVVVAAILMWSLMLFLNFLWILLNFFIFFLLFKILFWV
jgi:hypothetical protein